MVAWPVATRTLGARADQRARTHVAALVAEGVIGPAPTGATEVGTKLHKVYDQLNLSKIERSAIVEEDIRLTSPEPDAAAQPPETRANDEGGKEGEDEDAGDADAGASRAEAEVERRTTVADVLRRLDALTPQLDEALKADVWAIPPRPFGRARIRGRASFGSTFATFSSFVV